MIVPAALRASWNCNVSHIHVHHSAECLLLHCQVWLPRRASRLILATDGVWDAFDTHYKVASVLRGVSLANAASVLLQRTANKRVFDDKTVLVVDIVPDHVPGFKSQVRRIPCYRVSQPVSVSQPLSQSTCESVTCDSVNLYQSLNLCQSSTCICWFSRGCTSCGQRCTMHPLF